MPQGRMLNRRISVDEELGKLSKESIILYTWSIPHLDVEGKLLANTQILKGVVVPYLPYMTNKVIEECVKELSLSPLILLYGGGKYIKFLGFGKNQTVNPDREAPSEIPNPTPEELQSKSRETPAKDKLSKDKLSKDNIYVSWENSIISLWNNFCKENPTLSTIKEISDKRRAHLKKRFEKESFRGFDKIIEAIKEQPFLMGQNERGWKVSFDWLIDNDTNYLKVLERKYKNQKNSDKDTRRLFKLKE